MKSFSPIDVSGLRILRLTPFFYWPPPSKRGWPMRFDPVGGMANQIFQLGREFSLLGIEQIILTLGMTGAPRRWRPYEHTRVYAVRVPWPPLRSEISGTVGLVASWGIGVILWCLWHVIRGGSSQVDVIHCHFDCTIWPPLVGLITKRLYRKPLVVTVSSSRLATFISPYPSLFKKWLDYLEVLALREADTVHVLTYKTHDFYLKQGYVKPEQVVVIGDVVDADRFEAGGNDDKVAAFRKRFQLPDDKKLIVFASRVSFEKGWEYFVQAAHLLRNRTDIHFLIASDGLQRKRLDAMIASFGLQERFTITGYLPHAEMPAALASGYLFVLPSKFEELGSVSLEVMALGCPIVAADVGGIPEVVGNANAGILVPPRSPEAIATAVAMLLDDEAKARELGRRGKEYVRATYEIKKCVGEYLQIYSPYNVRMPVRASQLDTQ